MDEIYKKELKEFYVTYTLIIINVIVFILMTLAGGSTKTIVLILFGAKVNQLIDMGQYWRLFTSMFLHIGFTHLLFNIYALIALGKYTEKIFSHIKLLVIYIFSGITGSSLSYLLSPNISAGASGAIFGLLGALVSYGWKNSFIWHSGFIKSLLIILGINLVLGLIIPGIDNFAHLGGLLGGSVIGLVIRLIEKNSKNLH